MDYEHLLIEADNQNLIVREKPLINNDGLIKGKRIAIRNTIETSAEKACVLAEELGHYYTSTGDILDQSSVANRKQEARARLWGYQHMVTIEKLTNAKRAGCRNAYEIAKYIGTTEEYLLEAIEKYKSIYGICVQHKDYLVLFEPCFNILQMM